MHRTKRLFAGRPSTRALPALLVLMVNLAGCSGIDLHDNPSPDVSKQTGPLTAPPTHLRNGGE